MLSEPSLTRRRFRGRVAATGIVVALKKLTGVPERGRDHGADPSALREIRVLKEISHPNVVGLLDAFFHKRSSARCVINCLIMFDMKLQ
jgi:hypothetical protein